MALIYRGREVQCDSRVIDWRESGLQFKPGSNGVRRRGSVPIQAWVWHWTAGEGNEKGCFRVLSGRGLSVQFYIRFDGVVFQYCDVDLICAHAGKPFNGLSLGTEMQSVGDGKPNPRFVRVRARETIHGMTAMRSQFYPAQITAAINLRFACAAAATDHRDRLSIGFPRGTDGLIPTRLMPLKDRLAAIEKGDHDFAHYMISRKKRDPGLHFIERLKVVGF